MNNNQTIKNMELILNEIEKGIKEGHVSSVKTLSDAYNNLLNEIKRVIYTNVKGMTAEIISIFDHKKIIENLLNKANEELTSAIVLGHHKDSHSYTIILERFNRSLRGIEEFKDVVSSFKNKKEFKVDKTIQDLLDLSIKTGTLVTFYGEVHRGKGKTTALIKKAHELGAVLLMELDAQAKYAKELADEMGIHVYAVSKRDFGLPQYRRIMKETGYLVDEVADTSTINQKDFKLLGGFQKI
ncbi:hypothetical protein ABE073_04990 [Lederbergia citrisecunda]|uniref:hypothetical protein n=1 Tax=Lederbergia citrisecunda TaxID=2833583 RepID=UPI003D28D5A6